MGFIDHIDCTAVQDPRTFAEYAEQELGIPWTRQSDMVVLKKKVKEFFAHYPHLDYGTLVHTVAFCKAKKRRFGAVWRVVDQVRWAYEAGFAPEMDTRLQRIDLDMERKITEALQVERDPMWRHRLLGSTGDGRREVLVAWQQLARESV